MLSRDVPYHVGHPALVYMMLQKLKYPLIFALILTAYGVLLFLAHPTLLGWETGHSHFLVKTVAVLYEIERDGWFFTVALAIFLSLIVVPEYRGLTIRLGEKAIYVRRGLMTYRETAIPYHQIQTINIVEAALPRMFGLCSLVIVTSAQASSDESPTDREAALPLIDKSLARAIQDAVLSMDTA